MGERRMCGVNVFGGPRNVRKRLSFAFASSVFSQIRTRCLVYLLSNVLIPFFLRRCHFHSSAATLIGLRNISAARHTHVFAGVRICFPMGRTRRTKPNRLD